MKFQWFISKDGKQTSGEFGKAEGRGTFSPWVLTKVNQDYQMTRIENGEIVCRPLNLWEVFKYILWKGVFNEQGF